MGGEHGTCMVLNITPQITYLSQRKKGAFTVEGVWQSASYNQVIKFILDPHGTVQYYVPPVVLQEEADSFTCVVFIL